MRRTLVLFATTSPFLLHAQVELVHDFGQHILDPFPREITVCGDLLYFTSYAPASGWELWVSNGTPGNAQLVKDINPGAGHGTPFGNQLTPLGDQLYFVADDGTHGLELWTSDGTEAGTTMVADLMAGNVGSTPDDLIALPDRVIFTAEVDGLRQLYSVQGTGITVVTDHVLDIDNTQRNRTVINGVAYFSAYTPLTNNSALWSSNGIGAELVHNIGANAGINFLTAMGNGFYFAATTNANGRELWHSTGAVNSAALVADIEPGTGGSFPTYLTVMGGNLFFVATNSGLPQWYRLDAGLPVVASALAPYVLPSWPYFATASDRIYFMHNEPGSTGMELYSTDGLPNGTIPVKDVDPGPGSGMGEFSQMAVFDDRLFFTGYAPTSGWELWTSDGTTEGTMLVEDLFSAGDARPKFFTRMGDHVYFQASHNANGQQLFRVAVDITTSLAPTTAQALRIFPNPARGAFQVQGAGYAAQVELIDALGRQVPFQRTHWATTMNIRTQAAGWHVVRITTANGTQTLLPVVLE